MTNLFGAGAILSDNYKIQKSPFQVIGVLAPKGLNTFGQDQDDLILAHIQQYRKEYLLLHGCSSIYTSAVDAKSTDLAAKQIEETLRRHHKIKDPTRMTLQSETRLSYCPHSVPLAIS